MKRLFITLPIWCVAHLLAGQNIATVQGIVKDAVTLQPLNGVSVTALNSKTAVLTAYNGFFKLQVVYPDTLLFTHINYQPYKVVVTAAGMLPEILLQPAEKSLEEVTINTGYQQLKPNEVNGSFTVVSNEKLNEQKGITILDRLNGVTPGLLFKAGKKTSSVNTTSLLSVRGESTINGVLDPLIILDNFPYDGDINNINPNDVESVTVLKDAAATSIYGAKGGNGVIIITTKKGTYNMKPAVEISTAAIIIPRPNLYRYSNLSVNDFINMEAYLFNQGYYNSKIGSFFRESISPAVEVFLNRKNGMISAQDSARVINYLKAGDTRAAYNSLYNTNTITLQNSFSVRGGSQYLAWMLGGNYDNTTNYDRSVNRRVNFRFNNRFKLGTKLVLEAAANYTNVTGITGSPAFNSIRFNNVALPYLRFWDEAGNAVAVAKDYQKTYTDTAGAGRLLNWNYYPALEPGFIDNRTGREDIVGMLGLTATIINGLTLSVTYQYQRQNNTQQIYYDAQSYYARDLVNRFTQLGSDAAADLFRVPKGGIKLSTLSNETAQNGRAQLTYNRHWTGPLTSLSGMAGMELRNLVTEGSTNSLYGYSESPVRSVPVDYNTRYPVIITGFEAAIPNPPSIKPITTNRYVSAYCNLAARFYDRFLINASLRKDAANTFGLKTNDKWNPFWSSGIGWELSRERFFHWRLFNYLKLKATLGTSGIVNANKTADALVSFTNDYITNFLSGQVFTLNNPNLRWEKSKQIDVGLEFATRGNRVTGTIDYYNKKGKDLYGTAPFNYTAWGGSNTMEVNIANMEGNGFDIAVNAVILKKKVQYSSGIIFNYNQSKTTQYLGPDANKIALILGDGNLIVPLLGKPLYSIAAYKWGGLNAAGDPQGFVNGVLSTDYLAIRQEANEKGIAGNIIYMGPANPVFYGAWNHSLQWKGLMVTVNLQYKLGYYFRRSSLNYQTLYTTGIGNSEYQNRWQQAGDETVTNVPARVYTSYPQFIQRNSFYESAEINVLRGDHIRLQYINLLYGWSFKHAIIKTAILNFNVANLGIIWRKNKYGLDPDFDYTSTIPPRPQFTIGLAAGF